jgi:hypothetical protein
MRDAERVMTLTEVIDEVYEAYFHNDLTDPYLLGHAHEHLLKYQELITRAQQLEECLRDVYDWLKKNKMEHTAHGKFIAEVLNGGG